MLRQKNDNIEKSNKKLCSDYCEGVIIERQLRNLFAEFRSGDTSSEGQPRSSHSSNFNNKALKPLMEYTQKLSKHTICKH